MIEIKSLMLDNWILDGAGNPVQVTFLQCYDRPKINLLGPQHWSPIPLTPELVSIKIGWPIFLVNDEWDQYVDPTFAFAVAWCKKTGQTFTEGEIIAGYNEKTITFLHELQNHYRWEVGTDLNIIL